jgi:hypothetical protein
MSEKDEGNTDLEGYTAEASAANCDDAKSRVTNSRIRRYEL